MTCTKVCGCSVKCHEPIESIAQRLCRTCTAWESCHAQRYLVEEGTTTAKGWYCSYYNVACRPPWAEKEADEKGQWKDDPLPIVAAMSSDRFAYLVSLIERHDQKLRDEGARKLLNSLDTLSLDTLPDEGI